MKKNGFSLIELAIVLTIIGIIISGSLTAAKVMRKNAKETEAKNQVIMAKDAIIGFSIAQGYLPTSAEFTNNLSPVKGNQKQMLYYAEDKLVDTICAYKTTNLEVDDKSPNEINPSNAIHKIQNVAFVVASAGANYNMQTAVKTGTPDIVDMHAAFTKIDDNTTPINRASDEYDDIVQWVTLSQLQQNIRCDDNIFRIVNDQLPSTYDNLTYSATILVDGNYTAPIANSCTFNPNTEGFIYNNYTISRATPTAYTGTVAVECSVGADERTINKLFVITVNPSPSDANGTTPTPAPGACTPGSGVFNSYCTSNSDCQSCNCNTASGKCKN